MSFRRKISAETALRVIKTDEYKYFIKRGEVLDRKQVENYLLETYILGETDTLEMYLLKTSKRFALSSIIFYLMAFGDIFFDSWASFAALDFIEDIDVGLAVFTLLSIPLCALSSILIARSRMPKVQGGAFYTYYITEKTKSVMGYAFPLVLILGRIGRGAGVGLDTSQALFALGCFFWLATSAKLYRIYLMRKYCPYLANYRGGRIERPDE